MAPDTPALADLGVEPECAAGGELPIRVAGLAGDGRGQSAEVHVDLGMLFVDEADGGTSVVTAGLSCAKDGDVKSINEAVVDLMAASAVFAKGDWSCVEGSKSTGATISLPAVADQPSTKAFIRALQRGVPSGGLIISIPLVLDQTKITYYWKQDCPIFHLGE